MRGDLNRIGLISVLLAAASLILLYIKINGIRITTADELHAAKSAADITIGKASRLLDLCIGRFYAVIKWPVLEFLMRDCSDSLLSIIRIGAFVSCAGCAAKFIRDALRSIEAGALSLALSCAFLPVLVTYQPLFYNPLLWIGWAAVWLMGVIALRPKSKWNTGLTAGLFGLALLSHEMNAVFVVLPWLVRSFVAGEGWRLRPDSTTLSCGVVVLVYGALAVSFRISTAHLGISYTGGEVTFDAEAAGVSLLANSLGIAPGLELWLSPRWLDMTAPIFVEPGVFWQRLLIHLRPIDVLLALGIGGMSWLFINSEQSPQNRTPRPRMIPLLGVLTFMVFSPNLLLSLTEKYQNWAYQKMWPYYYSWMSYIALIMILVVGMDYVRVRCRKNKTTAVLIALVITWVAAVSAATSRESSDFFRNYRFDHSAGPPIRK